jgi:hypothetical protein
MLAAVNGRDPDPIKSTTEASRPPVVIDAMNLAYWCGPPPSLRLPLGIAAALIEAGHAVQLVFDASAPHRLAHEQALYSALRTCASIAIEVPRGRRADGEILRRARSNTACVLSRDHFADYRARYRRLIDDPARRFGGVVDADTIHVAALGIVTPLPDSAAAAWARMQAVAMLM